MLDIKIDDLRLGTPTKNITEQFWNLFIRNKDVPKLTPFELLCLRTENDVDGVIKLHFLKHTNKTIICLENRKVYRSVFFNGNRRLENVSESDDVLFVVRQTEIELVLSIKGE